MHGHEKIFDSSFIQSEILTPKYVLQERHIWVLSFFFHMHETSATIVIPTASNVELTIIATSFFSPERLFFSRCFIRPIQSQVSLRITLFVHTLGRKCGQISG
jgi:hypothetical protein